MRVQRLLMPEDGAESYTVLADDHGVVEPVEAYLAYLAALERSPNTVRAYAHDLRDFFAFLEARGLGWTAATVENVGAFVAWLRLPASARAMWRCCPAPSRRVRPRRSTASSRPCAGSMSSTPAAGWRCPRC